MTEAAPNHTVAQGTRDPADTATHIERINGPTSEDGGNPADGPEPAPDLSAERKPYRLLMKSFVGGVLREAGRIVMLLPHEVGAHHEPVNLAPLPPPPVEANPALDAAHRMVSDLMAENERLVAELAAATVAPQPAPETPAPTPETPPAS